MVSSVPYEVVRHLGEAEVRRYDDMVLVTVYDMEEDEAFQLLFRFISGDNDAGTKIAMTTPVVSRTGVPPDPSSEGHLSFILPAGTSLEKAPRPRDPRVVLELKKGGLFAVMRFRGRAGGDDVQRMTQDLMGQLKEANFDTHHRPFLLRYNSPFTPGFMRHNEVAVRVVPRSVELGE
ncbi:MAG TPA: heme-binding protein [Methanomassiliicoccales archaeon]|nr:heme-binding protein [Methanomassiliicoccales archaeon]